MIETRRILLAGTQTARGTAATLTTSSNFLEASGIGSPKLVPIDVADTSFSHLDTPLPSDHVDAIWEPGEHVIPVRLASSAATSIPIAPLLLACGLVETHTASNSLYKWSSQAPSARKLASIDLYNDGELFKLMDIAGTGVIRGKVGESAEFAFTGKGVANGTTPSAAAFPTSTSPSSTQGRLIVQSASVITQGGSAINVSEFSIDFGSDVQEFYDTSGRGFEVAGWAPKLTITKLAAAASSDWAALRAATSLAFNVTLGTTRTMVIAIPAAVPEGLDMSANNKRQYHQLTCALHDSAGDDAISITAT